MTKPVNYITEYNKKIKSGKMVAGKWVKLIYAYLANGLRKRSFYYDAEKTQLAIDFIERHGQITLQEYANLNNVSRSKASRELNKLEDIEGSGIRGYGNAPHKVWKKE